MQGRRLVCFSKAERITVDQCAGPVTELQSPAQRVVLPHLNEGRATSKDRIQGR